MLEGREYMTGEDAAADGDEQIRARLHIYSCCRHGLVKPDASCKPNYGGFKQNAGQVFDAGVTIFELLACVKFYASRSL